MIECPMCKHQEFVGTLYCSECGTRLVLASQVSTISMDRDSVNEESLVTKPSPPEGPDLESGALVGLRILSSGDILSMIGRDNFTLGRSGKGQAVIPDLDLNPFDAYEQGISRIHAEIRLRDDGIYVIDLDSANGTLVNGRRLSPQEEVLVQHGDIIQLGRFRLQLISRYRG